jgi:hypothetical protein
MKQIRIFLLASTLFLSCQTQDKFDKGRWQTKEDPAFPPQSRKAMLKDLRSNYKLTGQSRSQLIELLGEPDYVDDSSITYKIEEKFGSAIDPIYTKTLEIKVNEYEKAKAVAVREWKK